MQSLYLAVGFSTITELGCGQVMGVVPADRSLFKLFSFFLWQVLLDLIVPNNFSSHMNISRTRPINTAGRSGNQNVHYRGDIVCLNFKA